MPAPSSAEAFLCVRDSEGKTPEVKYVKRSSGSALGPTEELDLNRVKVCLISPRTVKGKLSIAPEYMGETFCFPLMLRMLVLKRAFSSGVR